VQGDGVSAQNMIERVAAGREPGAVLREGFGNLSVEDKKKFAANAKKKKDAAAKNEGDLEEAAKWVSTGQGHPQGCAYVAPMTMTPTQLIEQVAAGCDAGRVLSDALREDFATSKGVKNKWVDISHSDMANDPDLEPELLALIKKAYAKIGGHVKFRSAGDVASDPSLEIDAVDVDDDPQADAVTISKRRAGGKKSVAAGSDGSSAAKASLMKHKVKSLGTPGHYGEVSGALAHVLLTRYTTPVVTDEAKVRATLKGKEIEWVGAHPNGKYPAANGWYYRVLGGQKHLKIMVGRPT
jgi:hypothetical protein